MDDLLYGTATASPRKLERQGTDGRFSSSTILNSANQRQAQAFILRGDEHELKPFRPDCYTSGEMFGAAEPGRLMRWGATATLLVAAITLRAQEAKSPEISPAQLVREAVANEIAAANNSVAKHMFRSQKQTPKGSQTKLYVETNDALAGMLVATNDEPLNAQQQQEEINHLNWLAGSPEQLRKKRAREKEDTDRTLGIVKALPDAFRYEYAGTADSEPGLGKPGDQLVRLKFSPNPSYSPPSRVEQALEGMQGVLLIDASAKRLALIDGTLFRDVSFGWGIIGHLDKGGHFLVKQADDGDGTWDITEMNLKITGKILVFKSISMISDEVLSDFRRVPDDITFTAGVDLLKAERDRLARLHAKAPAAVNQPPK